MLVVLAMISACSQPAEVGSPAVPGPTSSHAVSAASEPGTLVSSSPDFTVDVRISRARASATQITYRSTSGANGNATTVTGMVFTPHAAPPPGGYPVVVYGHPIAGLTADCAPSQHPDLLGNGAAIESLLNQGYLVVMTDYQRDPGTPYLYAEATTLGRNIIDAVRATRALVPQASSRWAAFGVLEGGEAAWAAAELAPSYGQGLEMVAAVALNPTANLAPLPYAALDGNLKPPQFLMMLYAANAIASQQGAPLDEYVHGYIREHNDALLDCSSPQTRAALASGMSAADLIPASQEAAERMSAVLRENSLPGSVGVAEVPVLVMVGAFSQAVWQDWTKGAVSAACDRGERITWLLRRTEGDNDLQQRPAVAWLGNQFTGTPVGEFAGPSEGAVCNST